MEIETCDAQPARCLRHSTSLQNGTNHPGQIAQAAENTKTQPSGPLLFIYHDMTNDLQVVFEREIALPVASATDYGGEASVTLSGALRSTGTVHTGELRQLGEIVQTFFAQLGAAGLKPAGEKREVYTHFVDSISMDKVTHIQVGI